MVNNFEIIKPLLKFESEDHFYYLQILQRKKEVDTLTSNSNVVKNYYISSMEYLDRKEKEIIELCNHFNARAMLRLNRRSYRQIALRGLEKIAGQCASEDYRSVKKFYERVCGRYNIEEKKLWILDIDEEVDKWMFADIESFLETIEPKGPKVQCVIPSKAGCHIITHPFNVAEASKSDGFKYIHIDIHKDNPTNLYIPQI